jgi:hypothetical protein
VLAKTNPASVPRQPGEHVAAPVGRAAGADRVDSVIASSRCADVSFILEDDRAASYTEIQIVTPDDFIDAAPAIARCSGARCCYTFTGIVKRMLGPAAVAVLVLRW